MRPFDASSWQAILSSVLGLALFALIGVGIRVLLTMTIQQRRERANRQINERLKTLMSAYKVLGGSFTGDLAVDPTHLSDLRRRVAQAAPEAGIPGIGAHLTAVEETGSDRSRRIRDAVEAALSDILLLGTESQVRLAARAVLEMVEGRPIHTAELVVSLRDFIRKALDLDPIPADVRVPHQGPARPAGTGGNRAGRNDGAKARENGKDGRESGFGDGGGGAAGPGPRLEVNEDDGRSGA